MMITGAKSKKKAVILSMQELIRRNNVEKLKKLRGKVNIDFDTDKQRRNKR